MKAADVEAGHDYAVGCESLEREIPPGSLAIVSRVCLMWPDGEHHEPGTFYRAPGIYVCLHKVKALDILPGRRQVLIEAEVRRHRRCRCAQCGDDHPSDEVETYTHTQVMSLRKLICPWSQVELVVASWGDPDRELRELLEGR